MAPTTAHGWAEGADEARQRTNPPSLRWARPAETGAGRGVLWRAVRGRGGKQCITGDRPRGPGSPRPGLKPWPLIGCEPPRPHLKAEPTESHHVVTARTKREGAWTQGVPTRVSCHCPEGSRAGGQPWRHPDGEVDGQSRAPVETACTEGSCRSHRPRPQRPPAPRPREPPVHRAVSPRAEAGSITEHPGACDGESGVGPFPDLRA